MAHASVFHTPFELTWAFLSLFFFFLFKCLMQLCEKKFRIRSSCMYSMGCHLQGKRKGEQSSTVRDHSLNEAYETRPFISYATFSMGQCINTTIFEWPRWGIGIWLYDQLASKVGLMLIFFCPLFSFFSLSNQHPFVLYHMSSHPYSHQAFQSSDMVHPSSGSADERTRSHIHMSGEKKKKKKGAWQVTCANPRLALSMGEANLGLLERCPRWTAVS